MMFNRCTVDSLSFLLKGELQSGFSGVKRRWTLRCSRRDQDRMSENESEGISISLLLREVEPELMDALIEATKDGNHSRLRALSVSKVWFGKDDDEEEEDFEQEQEEEEYREHSSIASRWFDGLISKDIQMATEVFSIHAIDFDRQSIYSILNNSMSAI
ncbi:uncharacterized protein LOC104416376 isoform X3 [Eucalyptus grandis]|uniref:uncharacterized protein LOC104416376 isoform X3 n=1 Tax=Eucalyptus grandis TaxID=71139 RepID=UPI00192EF152|nr:uncharacterized protein LOC104416376 isoform X3 [Eucalyptus grandis]